MLRRNTVKKKYCPQCGTQQPADAKFCSKCGYDFGNLLSRRSQRRPDNKWRKRIILISIIVVILVISGVIIGQRNNHYASHDVSEASSSMTSSSTDQATSASEDNETNAQSQPQSSGNALSTNIGPKVSAAAITYYAVKTDTPWQDFLTFDKNEGITVRLSTDRDLLDKLTEKGQGMAYEVFGNHDADEDSDPEFVYTIDKDDDINIYYLSHRSDADSYDPVTTVSRQEIVDYLNTHHYANATQQLGEKVIIEK